MYCRRILDHESLRLRLARAQTPPPATNPERIHGRPIRLLRLQLRMFQRVLIHPVITKRREPQHHPNPTPMRLLDQLPPEILPHILVLLIVFPGNGKFLQPKPAPHPQNHRVPAILLDAFQRLLPLRRSPQRHPHKSHVIPAHRKRRFRANGRRDPGRGRRAACRARLVWLEGAACRSRARAPDSDRRGTRGNPLGIVSIVGRLAAQTHAVSRVSGARTIRQDDYRHAALRRPREGHRPRRIVVTRRAHLSRWTAYGTGGRDILPSRHR